MASRRVTLARQSEASLRCGAAEGEREGREGKEEGKERSATCAPGVRMWCGDGKGGA